MDTPDSEPEEAPPPDIPRVVSLAFVSAAVPFLLLLAVAAHARAVREAVAAFLGVWPASDSGWKLGPAASGAVILIPAAAAAIAIFAVAWRRGLHTWRALAPGLAAVAAVLAYLAVDDRALRHPLTMEQLSPSFPGAEDSFKILMRYGLHTGLGKDLKVPAFKGASPDWKDMDSIVANRAEIEEHWQALLPERAWWVEINAFERIGDLTQVDGDLISFQVLRTVTQHGEAVARLQAMDGNGDAAVATLVPIIQVARKLQPTSRTLVRAMMGVVMERTGIAAAEYVLKTARVSEGGRIRLAAALEGGDAEAGARHLAAITYAYDVSAFSRPARDVVASARSGDEPWWMRYMLSLAGPFIFNPRSTLNAYGDLCADMQDFAEHREIDKLAPRIQRFVDTDARPRFKNLLGRMLMENAPLAYPKVVENYWTAADERAALLAQLKEQ
jgi:hypothetical protein